MSGTLHMFDRRPIKKSLIARKPSIREAFEAFHEANPQVFMRLREMALEWKARGFERCAIATLWETLRWNEAMGYGSSDYDICKLNNNFRAHYARKLMEHEAELEGFFETRKAKE